MSGLTIPHFGLKRQYKNLKEELLNATDEVLSTGILINGQATRSFENWLKYKTKTQYAVAVHSGTQALEIIAKFQISEFYLNQFIGQQPNIKIPNLTYPATLNAFLTAGYNDIELIDTDKYGIIKEEDYSTVVCVVGLYGKKPWSNTYVPYGTPSNKTIVDGAQHWLVADGDVGLGMAISFDPTKNLNASGNGGAIVTNNEHLYMYASSYRDNCKPYFHESGTNSKMSEIECNHLLVRSKYIDDWQKRRQLIAKYWCERFNELPVSCLSDTIEPHAHQKFVMYLSDRNSLHTHLILNGIESKKHYEYVLGDLPVAKNFKKPDMLSTSVMLSRGVLSLPLYPELTDNEVEYIANKVDEYFGE